MKEYMAYKKVRETVIIDEIAGEVTNEEWQEFAGPVLLPENNPRGEFESQLMPQTEQFEMMLVPADEVIRFRINERD